MTWRARWSIVTGPDADDALDDAPLGAAQHGADPAAQLGQAERLGDVVVGARLEALDDVGLAVERGEHDDRHDGAPGAQRAGDVVAGGAGAEGDVEQHDVEVLLGGARERLVAVGDGGHPVALALEGAREHVAQRRVVVDDQDVQRGDALHSRRTVAAPSAWGATVDGVAEGAFETVLGTEGTGTFIEVPARCSGRVRARARPGHA